MAHYHPYAQHAARPHPSSKPNQTGAEYVRTRTPATRRDPTRPAPRAQHRPSVASRSTAGPSVHAGGGGQSIAVRARAPGRAPRPAPARRAAVGAPRPSSYVLWLLPRRPARPAPGPAGVARPAPPPSPRARPLLVPRARPAGGGATRPDRPPVGDSDGALRRRGGGLPASGRLVERSAPAGAGS
ncbi:hypothetical protein PVAP13_3KG122432 [Panicum virgatum]|uniref:Uncharacterized protein n=1 Tax=Panicum virgatum TaxID=38727 RepID=A0A8T0UWP0_PANVG|nr:hypothetical protein PVAP13_3KG122432 [Panicum virgatum]